MTRKRWSDLDSNGRNLVYTFNKLMKKIRRSEDTDELCNLAKTLGFLSQQIKSIAKDSDFETRLKNIEAKLNGEQEEGNTG